MLQETGCAHRAFRRDSKFLKQPDGVVRDVAPQPCGFELLKPEATIGINWLIPGNFALERKIFSFKYFEARIFKSFDYNRVVPELW